MVKHWGHGLCLLFLIMSFVVIANTKICLGAGNVTVGCFAKERLALLQFRRGLTDYYGRLSSWVGKDCCRWEGVGCSGSTGRVVRLHLSGNDLVSGEVNSSLAELKHLRHLDLSGNYFGGSKIPNFIGSLKQLRYLNLSRAGFVGIIPHHLGNLSSLNVLDLSYNYYDPELRTEDVEWVSRLSSLQYLDLTYVDLGGAKNIDNLFHNVPLLTEVHLSYCSLSKAQLSPLHLNSSSTLRKIQFLDLSWNFIHSPFLSFLRNMTSLQFLDLSGCNLGDQPYSFADLLNMLPSLSELHLSKCSLNNTHLSPTYLNFSTLSRIQNLDLSDNSFVGEFPSLLTNTSSLRILDLSWNHLNSSIPESLGKLIGLKVLNLGWNNLTGLIPTSFGKLTELEELQLHSNQLAGPIPTSFGKLTELKTLHLDSNQLTGPFPVWLSQLTKLTLFDVSSNRLEGSVSETHFANLSRLKKLDMSSNLMLIFNISPEWKPSFQLRSLSLCSSKIVQEFPHWIRTQRNIWNLRLSNASISGPLPRWLQDMTNIYSLDLSHNFITGPLTNLPYQLGLLFLQNNHIKGSIPKSLCKMTSISFLDISKNKLSGELPQCLEKLQALELFTLSSNRLSGLIPSFSFPSLWWLQLNNNTFQGHLPSSIGNSRSLELIDLGENNFFGSIPRWLGEKLIRLTVLRLHNNNFNGSIPRRLCQSSNIQILDLAHNNLTGTIPRCFGEFAGMTTPTSGPFLDGGLFEPTMIGVMNGVDNEYTSILGYLVNMDLSSNNLVGEIPKELTSCSRLLGLNLSHNHLSGGIPNEIGNMKGLISLDLSDNKLSGSIPSSIAKLTFLSHLNVSYNNFSGQIPSGNQIQTLNDPSIYAGNGGLCGEPLPKKCSDNHDPTSPTGTKKEEKDDGPSKLWLYLDIMSGFATGFWGIIGVLTFKKHWRQSLFRFVEITVDKIYLAIVVRVARRRN